VTSPLPPRRRRLRLRWIVLGVLASVCVVFFAARFYQTLLVEIPRLWWPRSTATVVECPALATPGPHPSRMDPDCVIAWTYDGAEHRATFKASRVGLDGTTLRVSVHGDSAEPVSDVGGKSVAVLMVVTAMSAVLLVVLLWNRYDRRRLRRAWETAPYGYPLAGWPAPVVPGTAPGPLPGVPYRTAPTDPGTRRFPLPPQRRPVRLSDADLALIHRDWCYRVALWIFRLTLIFLVYVAWSVHVVHNVTQLPRLLFVLPAAIPGLFGTLVFLWAAGSPIVGRVRGGRAGFSAHPQVWRMLRRDLFWYRRLEADR
jgi:hypothetical protein